MAHIPRGSDPCGNGIHDVGKSMLRKSGNGFSHKACSEFLEGSRYLCLDDSVQTQRDLVLLRDFRHHSYSPGDPERRRQSRPHPPQQAAQWSHLAENAIGVIQPHRSYILSRLAQSTELSGGRILELWAVVKLYAVVQSTAPVSRPEWRVKANFAKVDRLLRREFAPTS